MRATRLLDLPPELAQDIFELLPNRTLRQCNLVCKWAREHASNVLWRDVILTDRQRVHTIPADLDPSTWFSHEEDDDGYRGRDHGCDSHDDTPMIRQLFLLAKYPEIASKVRSLTHRCHLPRPALFAELPEWSFTDCTISNSWKTLRLLRLAIANLKNVRVLRLVAPHFFIATTLLRGFFDPRRTKIHPVQHLWLENVCLESLLLPSIINSPEDFDEHLVRHDPRAVPRYLDLRGLESLRFRRLWADTPASNNFVRARNGPSQELHNGRGSVYFTSVAQAERFQGHQIGLRWISSAGLDRLDQHSCWLNERTWTRLPEILNFIMDQEVESTQDLLTTDHFAAEAFLVKWVSLYHIEPPQKEGPISTVQTTPRRIPESSIRLQPPYETFVLEQILQQSMSTLTSLCLDWLMWSDPTSSTPHTKAFKFLSVLSQLRFPHLRAFQYKNATSKSTALPKGVYLLTPTSCMMAEGSENGGQVEIEVNFLDFMLAHQHITCLAWPMENFFMADDAPSIPLKKVQRQVIDNLGQTLESLRIDAWLTGTGEPQTDADPRPTSIASRSSRRKFIEDLAPYMNKIRTLKMEGCIPKDEQRQVLHVLRHCPLEKVVQIGVNQPLGNTWGENGVDISSIEGEFGVRYLNLLEAEPQEGLEEAKSFVPSANNKSGSFEPVYGTTPSPSLLYVIASHFGSTITELKFCGYNGAPILRTPTPITSALLWHLRYFPRLRNLAITMWLLTTFEVDLHEPEILDLWLAERKEYTIPTRAPVGWGDAQVREEPFDPMRAILERIPFEEHAYVPEDHSRTHNGSGGGNLSGFQQLMQDINGQGTDSEDEYDNTETQSSFPPRPLADQIDSGETLSTGHASLEMDAPSLDIPVDVHPRNTDFHSRRPSELERMHSDDRLDLFINSNFRPAALAEHVNDLIGGHLSPLAKARKGTSMGEDGVRVRASFCIGIEQSDIFELDVWIDSLGACGYRGPIEEGNWGRWLNGLDTRAWFGRYSG